MRNTNVPLITSPEKPLAQRVKEFNPYKSPPDFELAKAHGIARRVCKPYTPAEYHKSLKCPCCHLPFENKQFRVGCDVEQLSSLGVCFPLYFSYIKFCVVLLCICLSISGIMNLIYNLQGTNCNDYGNSFICKISFMNVLDSNEGVQNLNRQSLLNTITIIVLLIAFEIYRYYQRGVAYQNRTKYSVSDFALFISFLPNNFNQDEIEDFLNFHLKLLNRPTTKVVKIYHLHQLGEYAKLYSTKRELVAQRTKSPLRKSMINAQIDDLNTQLRELEKSYDAKMGTSTDTRVIVIVESAKAAKTLQSYFRKQFIYTFAIYVHKYLGISLISQKRLYKNLYVRISKAPEPSDIKWENLSFPSVQKFKRRILTAFVCTCLIVLGFSFLTGLKKLLKQVQTTASSDISQYVSIGVSLLGALFVAITNTILGIYTRRFVRYEKHKTQTGFFVTVGKILSAVLVLNMTLTTLGSNMAQATAHTRFYKLSITGLFYDTFFLFITNSYMSSIFNFFDIMWGVKLIKRYRALKAGKNSQMHQIEANTLFEGHPVDMALRFANVNKTLIFTGLFIPFIPLGIIFSMVGFCITYWVDKYLLLRRYVCANNLSYALPKAMFITAEWFMVAYASGNLFIFFLPADDNGELKPRGRLHNTYFWFSTVLWSVVIIYKLFIPSNFVHNFFTKVRVRKEDVLYSEIKEKLPEDYDKFHPIYRRHGLLVSEMQGVEDFDDNIHIGSQEILNNMSSGNITSPSRSEIQPDMTIELDVRDTSNINNQTGQVI